MGTLAKSAAPPFVLVVALDLANTDSGGYALDQALRVATRIPGSQLHVLHVAASPPTTDTLGLLRHYVQEKARALEVTGPQTCGVHVRSGEPATQIAQLAADLGADLIVVGSHRPHPLRSLVLGSTATRLMAATPYPVVVSGPRPKPEAPHVITIEGPCQDCVETRVSTEGRSWWCARHSEHHPVMHHHHLYSYHSELPFEGHDSEVSPTGAD